jgi:transcriptional regulator GlxA family with amidase domain
MPGSTDVPTVKIAVAVDHGNLSRFAAAFRKAFGLPGAYRRKWRS